MTYIESWDNLTDLIQLLSVGSSLMVASQYGIVVIKNLGNVYTCDYPDGDHSRHMYPKMLARRLLK